MEVLTELADCFLPAPITLDASGTETELLLIEKISYYALNIIKIIGLIIALPIWLPIDWIRFKALPSVTPDAIENLQNQLPKYHGFASDHFQLMGLGTRYSAVKGLEGQADWDKWLADGHAARAAGRDPAQEIDYSTIVMDVLTEPTQYIQYLKSQNVTSLRFSMPWSLMMPTNDSRGLNLQAVALYKTFIQQLQSAEIRPSVTMCHFVVPQWFLDKGGFSKPENRAYFVQYGQELMKTFPEVTNWWSFNELGVKGFQQLRGAYPMEVTDDKIKTVALSTFGMLMAHRELYQSLPAMRAQTLGITHQWLKFSAENPIGRAVAHVLENMAHYPIYNFLKTGVFEYKVPFHANYRFVAPEGEQCFDKIGVQAYPFALLKMGWVGFSDDYPAQPGKLTRLGPFAFGATTNPGEGDQLWFGPRHLPEGMRVILDEALALNKPICITEVGSDAYRAKANSTEFKVDRIAQKKSIEELMQHIFQWCKDHDCTLEEIDVWTDMGVLRESDKTDQIEWEQIHISQFPAHGANLNASTRRPDSFTAMPAGKFLSNLYGKELMEAEEAG